MKFRSASRLYPVKAKVQPSFFRTDLCRGIVPLYEDDDDSAARERLASLIEDVISTREVALITRRGYEPVAIIPAEELVGLVETAQLVRSPKNARRLLQALLRFYQGGDEGTEMSLDEIRLFVDRDDV